MTGRSMGLGADVREVARAELAQRIDALGRELPHLSTSALALVVDDIRRKARNHRLVSLAELAGGLERTLGSSGGSLAILPFLEAMSDAVDCDSTEPAIAARWLASVGVRLHG